MKRILCYGDSNTYGRSSNKSRFDTNDIWTYILQERLGDEYEVINEGLNSRTLIGEDPRGREGLDGSKSFIPTIEKHKPIDLLIWMLGTNQCKEQFDLSPDEIVALADQYYFQFLSSENIPTIIISLPPIVEDRALDYDGASIKPILINEGYEKLAKKYAFHFVDVYSQMKVGEEDGIHLTKESHYIIANAIAQVISDMFK